MHLSMLSNVLPQPDAEFKPDSWTDLSQLGSSVTGVRQIETKQSGYGL
jgi:hypothetical protein